MREYNCQETKSTFNILQASFTLIGRPIYQRNVLIPSYIMACPMQLCNKQNKICAQYICIFLQPTPGV